MFRVEANVVQVFVRYFYTSIMNNSRAKVVEIGQMLLEFFSSRSVNSKKTSTPYLELRGVTIFLLSKQQAL